MSIVFARQRRQSRDKFQLKVIHLNGLSQLSKTVCGFKEIDDEIVVSRNSIGYNQVNVFR